MVVALISRKFSKKDVLRKGMLCKRFGHDSRQKTRTTGSVGAMEGCVQGGRTDNEPGEDRRDAGLTSERGLEH